MPKTSSVNPSATITPVITTGDNSQVLQEIKQQLTTIQMNSFALDTERAKLERQSDRDEQKLLGSGLGLGVGFCMLFMFLPSPVTNGRQQLGLFIALGIIVGSLVIPFLWPW